jgi:hypothetical protein
MGAARAELGGARARRVRLELPAARGPLPPPPLGDQRKVGTAAEARRWWLGAWDAPRPWRCPVGTDADPTVPARLLELVGPRQRLGLFAVATLTHKSGQKRANHHGRCSGRFAPLKGPNEPPGSAAAILGAAGECRGRRGVGLWGRGGPRIPPVEAALVSRREGQGLDLAEGARRWG